MRIGIINVGNIGEPLARAWVAADHEVMVLKDGDARRLAPLTRDLDHERLTTRTLREAAALGNAEYGGDQDHIRLGFALLAASLGPVMRERDL